MAIKRLAGNKLLVSDEDLPKAVAALVGEAPGDWVRNLTTLGGYMRRHDGRIGKLSASVVEFLDKAQEKDVEARRLGKPAEASRQMRLAVLERISR